MRRMAWVAWWGVVALGPFSSLWNPARGAQTPSQDIVGRYGGRGGGVAASGNLAYYAEGDCLLALDVTNRQSPKVLTRTQVGGRIEELKILGTALIGFGSAGFQLFDISQASAPVLKSSLAGTFEHWSAEGKLICATYSKDFTVIDFSDLLHPRLRSTSRPVGPKQSWIYGVAVSAGRAYLLSTNDSLTTSGMSVVDLGNPDSPRNIGTKEFRPKMPEEAFYYGWSGGIAVRNGMVFTNATDAFCCFDVRNPQAITLVGGVECMSYGLAWNQIVLNGNVAYVKSCYDLNYGDIGIIDISNPARMVNHGTVALDTEGLRQMACQNPWLYVATANGLLIQNLTDPLSPSRCGRFASLGRATGVALAAGRAYVLGDALTIFDISDAHHPALVARSAINGLAGPLKVHNGFLYNLNTSSGLSIMDISKPDAPVLKGRIKTPGKAYELALDGHYAYIADGATLQVIDVANPASPRLVTMPGGNPASVRGEFNGIAVRDGRAFLGDPGNGLVIYDVSVVTAPKLLGRFTAFFADSRVEVALWKNLAIIGWGGHPWKMVLDISDPAKPRKLWGNEPVDMPFARWVPRHSFHLRDGQLFFSTSKGAVDLYDLRNPATPSLVSELKSANSWETTAEQIEVSGAYEYIANGDNGFAIVRYTNPYNRASSAWPLYR